MSYIEVADRTDYTIGDAVSLQGEPRGTPTFLAMANGQIKGVGNAGKGTRIGDMKRSFVFYLYIYRNKFNSWRGVDNTMNDDSINHSNPLPESEGKMSIGTAVLLTIITCGIY